MFNKKPFLYIGADFKKSVRAFIYRNDTTLKNTSLYN